MSAKAQASAERNVSSGKNIEQGEIKNVDDAIKASMKRAWYYKLKRIIKIASG
jgi:hypothetical protein